MTAVAVREDYLPATPAADSGFPDAAKSLVLWAESASAAYELSRRLVTTAFCPAQYKGKPEEAAAAMLAGAELGLSPMASLRAFDVIQGVTAPRALTLRAIVQSQGHEIVIEEATAQRVAGRGRRKGTREWQPYEFTIGMARELGLLTKDQWKKQPGTMLIARFTSGICRMIAADAILGIPYSIEELVDEQTAPGTETVAPKTTRVARAKPAPVDPVEPDLAPEDVPDEPVEAEIVPPTEAQTITPAQLKNVHRLLGKLGVGNDREAGLAYLKEAVGTDVASSKDLTLQQARQAIDFLMDLAGETDA